MATKKSVTEMKEEDVVKEQTAEEPAEKDPFLETVEMIVPRKPRGEEQQYYVCINDRRYMVPANGQMQKLPKPVALILQDLLDAEWKAEEYAEHIPNRAAEQINAI